MGNTTVKFGSWVNMKTKSIQVFLLDCFFRAKDCIEETAIMIVRGTRDKIIIPFGKFLQWLCEKFVELVLVPTANLIKWTWKKFVEFVLIPLEKLIRWLIVKFVELLKIVWE